MAEEVTIKVNQVSQGTALKDTAAEMDRLKSRIAEINQLQATYAGKGITGTSDLTAERTALQRQLTGLQREHTQSKRDEHLAEKAITQEQKERAAVAAAQQRRTGPGIGSLVGDAAGAAGVPGAGLISGGLAAGLATAVGAIIGKVIKDEIAFADTKNAEQGELTGTFNRSRRNRNRTNAVEAQQEATGEYRSNKKALEEAEDRRGTFRDSGITDRLIKAARNPVVDLMVAGPLGLFGAKAAQNMETSGEKGERENSERIARLKQEQARLQKDAQEAFLKGPGGAELEMKKALLNYDMRSVRALQDKITGQKEYDRVFTATGSKELANEAANNSVSLQQRDRAGRFAGLINARDGSRDVARVAALAGDAGGGQVWHRIHDTIRAQHDENKAGGLKDWTVPR